MIFAPPTLIADIRFCVTYPSNSRSAIQAAVDEYGVDRVLLDAIFCHPDDPNENPVFYFCPKYATDYSALEKTPIWKWYEDEGNRRNFQEIETIPEIQIVPGAKEFWIYFGFDPSLYELAMETLWSTSCEDARFVVVAPSPLPPHPNLRRADPSGKADLLFTGGTLREMLRAGRMHRRTFALGTDNYAAFQTVTVV